MTELTPENFEDLLTRMSASLDEMRAYTLETNTLLTTQGETLKRLPRKIDTITRQIDTSTTLLGTNMSNKLTTVGKVAVIAGILCIPAIPIIGIKGAVAAYGVALFSSIW